MTICWLATALVQFAVVFVQAVPTLATALLHGAFLQVLQAVGWLAMYSVALGGIYAPSWLLQHIVELLGPIGGLLIFVVILVVACGSCSSGG